MSKEVARQLPRTIITVALISGIAGFLINGRLQSEHITVLETQLTDLRQRFGVVPPENKYEIFTNTELRQNATPLLSDFRTFITEVRNELDTIFNQMQRPTPMFDQTPEEITRRNQLSTIMSKYQDRFDREFKVNLILLRNAMQKRLPKNYKHPNQLRESFVMDQMYQHPIMNTFVLTDLADDFEQMIKSLP